jgi:hypothetical protein
MAAPRQGQDYIARIRYSNALPPPPFAPKLLEIQNSGLSSGQYTSTGFASRLSREQPLNIEADAELGMRIDLVGLPGIFNEDQSAILFPEKPPPLDPRDRALLKPIASLGKAAVASSNVSFLRRTEYITSHQKGGTATGPLRTPSRPVASRRPPPKSPAQPARTDREGMIRQIEKSFNLAYPQDRYTGVETNSQFQGAEISTAEREAWSRPKHPLDANLTVLDSYPVLPDIDALPESGFYLLVKYNANPSTTSNAYDPKLDHLLLQPRDATQDQDAKYQAELAAHKADPTQPKPNLLYDFTAYLPAGDAATILPALKRKFDVFNPARDDPADYPDQAPTDVSPGPHFVFRKLRAYETTRITGNGVTEWDDSVAFALHDGPPQTRRRRASVSTRQKAAYVYPIMHRVNLRQQRQGTDRMGRIVRDDAAESGIADVFEITVGDWNEEAQQRVDAKRQALNNEDGSV